MSWSTEEPARGRLAACLALALGLHGGVFALLAPGLRPGLPAGQGRGGAVVELRIDAATTRHAPVYEAPRTTPGLAPPGPDASRSEIAIAGSLPTSVTEPTGGELRLPGPAGSDVYLPRRLLSVVPRLLTPILVPYPEDLQEALGASAPLGPAEARLVLTLYINELGVVDRAHIDKGRDLPAAFQTAAEQAFAAARFEPGEVEAGVVKSLIRVEVVFQSGSAER